MRHEFEGKVALVTGAGGRRGIGRATALRLARDGADVAVLDVAWPVEQRPKDEREQWNGVASVAKEVEAFGRRALALEADITVESQVQAAVAETIAQLGQIDMFVANAGARPGDDRVPVIELPEQALRRVISVNLIGTVLCCKAVGKHMAEKRNGTVVIVSSQSGRIGKARHAAYAASKFGQIGLTQAFAHEMASYNVRVNAVCPGLVDTARLDWNAATLPSSGSLEQTRARLLEDQAKAIPLGRIGSADDVAGVIAFMCSEDSRHMTGQVLGVDGGSRM